MRFLNLAACFKVIINVWSETQPAAFRLCFHFINLLHNLTTKIKICPPDELGGLSKNISNHFRVSLDLPKSIVSLKIFILNGK